MLLSLMNFFPSSNSIVLKPLHLFSGCGLWCIGHCLLISSATLSTAVVTSADASVLCTVTDGFVL